MIRVAIVDDHELMREGLVSMLSRDAGIEVAATFPDGESFLADATRHAPLDVVLIDVTLPTLDGFEILETLRSSWREPPPVVFLSMHPERTHAVKAIRAGAHGYLTKDASAATILEAIRTVVWGGIYLSETGHELLLHEQGGDRAEDRGRGMAGLSDQERRVFSLLYEGRTVSEIARILHISQKTVSTYKSRLMDKLGARSLLDLVRIGDGTLAAGRSDAATTPDRS